MLPVCLYFVGSKPLIMTTTFKNPFDLNLTTIFIGHWQSYQDHETFYEFTADGIVFNPKLLSQRRINGTLYVFESFMNHKSSVTHKKMVYGCFINALLLIAYNVFINADESNPSQSHIDMMDLKELIEIVSDNYFEYSEKAEWLNPLQLVWAFS